MLFMEIGTILLCLIVNINNGHTLNVKIGCYGHSMGSTHAWLVGPLEPRLKCSIGNCCLPTYEGIEEKHLLHCFPNFVPG